MATYNNLPVYQISLDENPDMLDHFMDFISIVKDPAVGVTGFRFADDKPYQKVCLSTTDEQYIIAPVAIPNINIYRNMKGLGEFYVQFSTEVIAQLMNDFASNPKPIKINMNHDTVLESGYIMESWLIEDATHDKSVKYGFNLPIGTWMAKIKIKDIKEWATIKAQDLSSFSLEAWLGLKMEEHIKTIMNKQINTTMENTQLEARIAELESQLLIALNEAKAIEEAKVELAVEDAPVDETVVEDAPVEDKAPEAISPEVQAKFDEMNAKFDELYKIIADLKIEEVTEDVVEEPAKFEAHQPSFRDLFKSMNK